MNSQKSHDEDEEEVIILMQSNRQNMSSAYEQEYSRDLLKKIKLAGDQGLTKIHVIYRSKRDKGILQMKTILKAHSELDLINRASGRAFDKFLKTNDIPLSEVEKMNLEAEDAIKIRAELLKSMGAHMIIFSEGYGDRLHPNYWGKQLNQNLLNSIHRSQRDPTSTISKIEEGIPNEGTITVHQTSTPQPWYKTPPQCTTSFLLKRKICPQYDITSGIVCLIQEGEEKRMTCLFESNKMTHAHKKEIWSKDYGKKM